MSRGGWILLEALTDSDESQNQIQSPGSSPLRNINPSLSLPTHKSATDITTAASLIESSNFVFDSFFKKQEAKLQHLDLGVNEQYIIGKYRCTHCCLSIVNTMLNILSF